MVIRKGKCYFALSNFPLQKNPKSDRFFKGVIKRIESRGRAINLCIDVGGYELNINEDLINEYHTDEQVTMYLYGKGVFYND